MSKENKIQIGLSKKTYDYIKRKTDKVEDNHPAKKFFKTPLRRFKARYDGWLFEGGDKKDDRVFGSLDRLYISDEELAYLKSEDVKTFFEDEEKEMPWELEEFFNSLP